MVYTRIVYCARYYNKVFLYKTKKNSTDYKWKQLASTLYVHTGDACNFVRCEYPLVWPNDPAASKRDSDVLCQLVPISGVKLLSICYWPIKIVNYSSAPFCHCWDSFSVFSNVNGYTINILWKFMEITQVRWDIVV